MATEQHLGHTSAPTLRDLGEALGTRSLPECCATRWRRSRFAAQTPEARPWATRLRAPQHGRASQTVRRDDGQGIHYDLGERHPLLGLHMPDLDLVTADGPLPVFTPLHDARPMLLNLDEPARPRHHSMADRVQLIDDEYVGIWELPVLGVVTAPTAVLTLARRICGLGGRPNPPGAP
ncbi:hypothetical protein AB0M95_28230 [Sphaerisporangium sp. NPDC051017]|uniref:aromatic-ring hydroxylase C-terminal domain-containing protein n=1 Tax=Sphaerisporangium sp. NPDC051017 TaxID=3154636 RepID=UPI003424A76B